MASASKFIAWSIRSVVIVEVLYINSCVEKAELLVAMSGNKIYNVYFIDVFQWPRHRWVLPFFYENLEQYPGMNSLFLLHLFSQVWTTSCLRWRLCPMKIGNGMSPFLWCWVQMTQWKLFLEISALQQWLFWIRRHQAASFCQHLLWWVAHCNECDLVRFKYRLRTLVQFLKKALRAAMMQQAQSE